MTASALLTVMDSPSTTAPTIATIIGAAPRASG